MFYFLIGLLRLQTSKPIWYGCCLHRRDIPFWRNDYWRLRLLQPRRERRWQNTSCVLWLLKRLWFWLKIEWKVINYSVAVISTYIKLAISKKWQIFFLCFVSREIQGSSVWPKQNHYLLSERSMKLKIQLKIDEFKRKILLLFCFCKAIILWADLGTFLVAWATKWRESVCSVIIYPDFLTPGRSTSRVNAKCVIEEKKIMFERNLVS